MARECTWDSYPIYKRLIDPLRAKARELGYCLAVHGTLKRDIDLVAIPWVEDAVDARTLAQTLMQTAAEHNDGTAFLVPHENNGYFWAGCPGAKPHGRLCWTIHLMHSTYLDLSVMPRAEHPAAADLVQAREEAERQGPMVSYVHGKEVTSEASG